MSNKCIARFATLDSTIDGNGSVVVEHDENRGCLYVYVNGGMLPDGTEHAEFDATERLEAIEYAMAVVAEIEAELAE